VVGNYGLEWPSSTGGLWPGRAWPFQVGNGEGKRPSSPGLRDHPTATAVGLVIRRHTDRRTPESRLWWRGLEEARVEENPFLLLPRDPGGCRRWKTLNRTGWSVQDSSVTCPASGEFQASSRFAGPGAIRPVGGEDLRQVAGTSARSVSPGTQEFFEAASQGLPLATEPRSRRWD